MITVPLVVWRCSKGLTLQFEMCKQLEKLRQLQDHEIIHDTKMFHDTTKSIFKTQN